MASSDGKHIGSSRFRSFYVLPDTGGYTLFLLHAPRRVRPDRHRGCGAQDCRVHAYQAAGPWYCNKRGPIRAAFWCGLFGHARRQGRAEADARRLRVCFRRIYSALRVCNERRPIRPFPLYSGPRYGRRGPDRHRLRRRILALPLKGNAFDCAVRGCAGGRYDKRLVRRLSPSPFRLAVAILHGRRHADTDRDGDVVLPP